MVPVSSYIGRFAPSPTGPLHLGSLATAIGSWLDARSHGGRWLLRIEDTDTPRCVPGAADTILYTLQHFGLLWDGSVLWQSQRSSAYQTALEQLQRTAHTFPCACSRKDIEHANGAVPRHHAQHYPGTCRAGLAPGKPARAVRFRTVNAKTLEPVFARWHEWGIGDVEENTDQVHGDFVIHRADGLWAYQLAVVVDDLAQGITHVVRGSDLRDSTGRQVALMQALLDAAVPPGQTPAAAGRRPAIPMYWHLPLILNAQGEKLSKQAGAQALNLQDPVAELNAAWRVFQLPAIAAATPPQWLEQALPIWNNWRRAFKPS